MEVSLVRPLRFTKTPEGGFALEVVAKGIIWNTYGASKTDRVPSLSLPLKVPDTLNMAKSYSTGWEYLINT
jgi:hypothetical protein